MCRQPGGEGPLVVLLQNLFLDDPVGEALGSMSKVVSHGHFWKPDVPSTDRY